MTKVRFAVIGVTQPHAAGYIETLRHLPEAEIVGGYDGDPDEARGSLPADLSALSLHSDIGSLLERERPEAVVICLPPVQTPDAIVLAAEHGCHIVAEKPCARSAAEFAPAVAAIERAGVIFSTGFLRHFSPVAIAMQEIVAEGLLGRLVSAEVSFVTTSVRRRDPTHWLFKREMAGSGILRWLGCHWIDLIHFVTAGEATEVNAILETCSGEPIDVEDLASVSLRYDNGMIGSINCAYLLDRGPDQISIGFRGTLGWMTWDGVGPELRVRSTHEHWNTAPTRLLHFEPDDVPGYGGAVGMLALRRFIAAFREGAPPPFTTGDVLRVLTVLDAAATSSRTGRRVAVNGSPVG